MLLGWSWGALGVLLGSPPALFRGRFWGHYGALRLLFSNLLGALLVHFGRSGWPLGSPLAFLPGLSEWFAGCAKLHKGTKRIRNQTFWGKLKAAGPSSLPDKLPIYKIKGGRGRRP